MAVKKKRRNRPVKKKKIPVPQEREERLEPTSERSKQGSGILKEGKSHRAPDNLEHLYRRKVLGEKRSEEAIYRLNAGMKYTDLYIIKHEKSENWARVNWNSFDTGWLPPENTTEDQELRIQKLKKRFDEIETFLKAEGSYGKRGYQVLEEVCGRGRNFKMIEAEMTEFVEGMAGVLLRSTLDDLDNYIHKYIYKRAKNIDRTRIHC